MYRSKRDADGVYTSVRLRPVKLLLFGIALLTTGLAAIGGDKLWAIPFGIVFVLLGGLLVYVSGRQMVRGTRTFLS